MAENRMTKRDHFAILRELALEAEMTEQVAFIDHEVELLSRKHGSGKLTASQRENIELKQEIVRVLNSGEKFRSGEVASELGITIQKSTALLDQIVNETESVTKVKEGKVTYFTTVE